MVIWNLLSIFFHSPESIPEENRKIWDQKIRDKLHTADPDCEWLTLPKAINQVETMIAANDGEKKVLLEGHLQYYMQIPKKLPCVTRYNDSTL